MSSTDWSITATLSPSVAASEGPTEELAPPVVPVLPRAPVERVQTSAPASAAVPVVLPQRPRTPRPSEHEGKLLPTGPSPHSGHKPDLFDKCPQLYAYKYILDVIPRENVKRNGQLNARGMGTTGHVGLAHFYSRAMAEQRGEDPEVFLPWRDAILVKAWEEDANEKSGCTAWTDFAATGIDTVGGYLNYWMNIRRDQMYVVGVEQVVDFSPLYGFPHTRSVDLMVSERDGKIYWYDHKFVGRLTKWTLNRYALDGQFLDYQIMGRHLYGERWGGAKINIVVWPKNGTVELHRDLIGAAPQAVAARLENVRRVRDQIGFLEGMGVDPWKYPKRLNESVCQGPFGACAGQSLCRFGREASPGHAKLAVLAE